MLQMIKWQICWFDEKSLGVCKRKKLNKTWKDWKKENKTNRKEEMKKKRDFQEKMTQKEKNK